VRESDYFDVVNEATALAATVDRAVGLAIEDE
jgi:hypothetical protein